MLSSSQKCCIFVSINFKTIFLKEHENDIESHSKLEASLPTREEIFGKINQITNSYQIENAKIFEQIQNNQVNSVKFNKLCLNFLH